MPFRTIPGKNVQYALISFDKDGSERIGDPDAAPGGKFSDRLVDQLTTQTVTNVFFFSHGWKGDVPAAIEQYDSWIGAMAARTDDRQQMEAVVPGFQPLWVGVHCPLAIAEQRERERGDRIVGTARGQHARVHTFREYDVDVDTSVTAPRQCAETILTALDARSR